MNENDVLEFDTSTDIKEENSNDINVLKDDHNSDYVSHEAVKNQVFDTMNEYTSTDPEVMGERNKIIRTRRLNHRFRDREGWVDEIEELDEMLMDDDDDE